MNEQIIIQQINADLYEQIKNQIQAQYRDSNVGELIKGIIDIKNQFILKAFKSLIKDNISLSTANGYSLDLWSLILNFNRFVKSDTSADFNYFNFNQKNFNRLIFFNKDIKIYNKLSDDNLRLILLFILQGMYIQPTLPKLNEFFLDFFAKFGKIRVKDSQNMNFLFAVTDTKLPEWLMWILQNYDIAPRPAGVGFEIREEIYYNFGFKIEKNTPEALEWEKFNRGNFDRSNFYPKGFDYSPLVLHFGFKIESEKTEAQQWGLKNVGNLSNTIFWGGQKEFKNSKIF